MAIDQVVQVVTEFSDWERHPSLDANLLNSTVALTASDNIGRTYTRTLWTSDSGDPRKLYVVSFGTEASTTAFRFFGQNAVGEIGQARIWGYSKNKLSTIEEYPADYLCTLTLHLGGGAIPNAGSGAIFTATDNFFATTIDVEADESLLPGIRVVGRGGGAPQLVIDGMGHRGYLVEMSNSDPISTTANPTSRLGFMVRRF